MSVSSFFHFNRKKRKKKRKNTTKTTTFDFTHTLFGLHNLNMNFYVQVFGGQYCVK